MCVNALLFKCKMYMKTKLLLSAAAVVLAGSMHAQSVSRNLKDGAFWSKVIKSQKQNSPQKTAEARPDGSPRYYTKASSLYFYDGSSWEEEDSMAFHWNGSNGLGVNMLDRHNDFFEFIYENYTNAFVDKIFNAPAQDFILDFPMLNFKKLPLLDSTQYYYSGNLESSTIYTLSNNRVTKLEDAGAEMVIQYNANGDITIQKQSLGNNWEKDSAVYNTSNQLVGFYRTNSFDYTSMRNMFAYNTSGKVIARSYLELDGSMIVYEHLDSIHTVSANQDSVVSFIWDNGMATLSHYTNIYHSNSFVDSIAMSDYSSSTEQILYFTRDASGNATEALILVDGDSVIKVTMNYDGDYYKGGSTAYYYMNNWENDESVEFTYDTDKNLTKVNTYSVYNPIIGKWEVDADDIELKFYYELSDEVSIPKVAASNVQVFPNPAQSVLNVALPNDALQQVAIYDVSGRTVLLQKFAKKEMKAQVDISVLKPGTYHLRVNGQKGATTFVKQ